MSIPIAQSKSFEEKLSAARVEVKLLDLKNANRVPQNLHILVHVREFLSSFFSETAPKAP